MLAVGSKLRDSCGKAKAGAAVLGLAVPVAPIPKIPRPSSGCKRKAPPTPSPSLDYAPADSADSVVGESRSPMRVTLDLHMKGKIGLEQVLPPLSHEVEAFTRETGLRLQSDSVVELWTGASGAGVQVFFIGRERPEEDAPTSGARAAEPGALEGEPPTQARDGVLLASEDGARDPFVTLKLVRGLVEAVGALPALKTQVGALSAALDVEMSKSTLALSELASERVRREAMEAELSRVLADLPAAETRARLAEERQKDEITRTRRAEEDLVVANLDREHAREEAASLKVELAATGDGPMLAPRARPPPDLRPEVVSLLLAQATKIRETMTCLRSVPQPDLPSCRTVDEASRVLTSQVELIEPTVKKCLLSTGARLVSSAVAAVLDGGAGMSGLEGEMSHGAKKFLADQGAPLCAQARRFVRYLEPALQEGDGEV
ncbi:uncharacterized protein LOC112269419 [Brachypodium distachyon]|uniref:uncharacterized protein LOC112269419 n=1 Tax=Brachypodium distachyon TaxID=15368 RepID=UPI000D0DED29|nr:uncharacterized protein LOC112269419 [Brachypodium distachyon]|eukprot:XP_024311904.1 uncharacterized protein LOC112269419 [Brachypodium distachyon]